MYERGEPKLVTPEILTEYSTVPEVDSFLGEIYKRRDSAFLSSRERRINLLHAGIDDLSVDVRKGAGDQRVREDLIARIISRIFCVSRSVVDLSIAEGMSKKFPLTGCSYCKKMPCECEDKNRAPYTLSESSIIQVNWTLEEWQTHLTRMYGDKNVEQGIHFVIGRLSSEQRELLSLESQIEHSPKPIEIDQVIGEYQSELADTLAWTLGAASVIGVNAQRAVVQRYGSGCSICKKIPCECSQSAHNFEAFNGVKYQDVAKGAPF